MLEKIFGLKAAQTTVKSELIAGVTTFAAMSYILAVNPAILSNAGMPVPALITVTAIAAALGCFLMAALTNYPIAQGAGHGNEQLLRFCNLYRQRPALAKRRWLSLFGMVSFF